MECMALETRRTLILRAGARSAAVVCTLMTILLNVWTAPLAMFAKKRPHQLIQPTFQPKMVTDAHWVTTAH